MTKLLTSKLLGSAPARSRRGRSVGRLNVARTACLIFAFCTAAAIASPAQTFDILFEFQGFDGSDPSDSPVQGFLKPDCACALWRKDGTGHRFADERPVL
jgi:hypothetical protein